MQKILVADDDITICDLLKAILETEGFEVLTALNGQEAVDLVKQNNDIDLIILDIVMPILYGTKSAIQIRKICDKPILFLTARSTDDDKVEAYNSGGDDYLQKPFSTVELVLRVKALLKRNVTQSNALKFSYNKREIINNGVVIKLTDKENEIFNYLYNHKGETLSIRDIYETVWQDKYLPSSNDTVMVFVLKLRKKLETDYTDPKHIITVWGKGYKYAE